MAQELLSWGVKSKGSQKLASTRKVRASTVALAAGLLFSITAVAQADNQPRGNSVGNASAGQPSGAAPVMAAPASADVMFKVSGFNVSYSGGAGAGAPSVAQIMSDAAVELRPVSGGFTTVEGARGTRYTIAQLNAELAKGEMSVSQRALEQVLNAIREAVNARGIVGVLAQYEQSDIEVRMAGATPTWVDVRQGRTTLNVTISLFNVAEVRSVGSGERLTEAESVNSPIHARLRMNSPVKSGGMLNKDALDSYALMKSRHPGRKVDVALSAADQPGMANLDYIVRENKPWAVYAQISNTGTEATGSWRERFGFYHNQLTSDDDILSLDYSTGNFQDSHAVQASYDRPFFKWDRIRVQVFGGYNRWDASEVGVSEEEFSGSGINVGGKVTWNFAQWRETFFDVYGGAKYAFYKVNNDTIDLVGSSGFFLPMFGLRGERFTETMKTSGDIGIEFNIPSWGGTSDGFDLDALGRADAAEDFIILSWGLTHSMFLEPWLDGKNFRDGKSTLAHELYMSFRGQTSFGERLVPNFQGVAGGLYTVRGYEESEQAGDDLLLFTAEYRLHIPALFAPQDKAGSDFFGNEFRWVPQGFRGPTDWDLIARAFCDVGYTGLADKLTFENDETMISAGVGLELQVRRNVNVRVDVGFPFNDTDRTDSGDPKIHFAATLLW